MSKAGQAASEPLPLELEEPAPSQQDQAKRRQERFEGWLKVQAHELKTGEAKQVLAELERLRTLMLDLGHLEAVTMVDKSLHYLRERQEMMRYAYFQAQGYPIGSGSVESANKMVVQSRMKQAGMRWEPRHVNAMLAMRNLACNGRWKEGWLAIRQRWQQQQHTLRELRAQAARAAVAVPLVPPHDSSPPASAVVQTSPASSSVEPRASSARVPILPLGSRQAGTHCWQRSFLRRRSA